MNTQATAILIDDEYSALKGLQQKLQKKHPEIHISATFQEPEKAVKYLQTHNPDIVFLDIQMPRINGFKLLTKLKEVNFQIVFVTAYNEFALKALKISAVDYILKPIDDDELAAAVGKVMKNLQTRKNRLKNEALSELLTNSLVHCKKMIIPTSTGMSFIPVDEIYRLEGYDGYTRIYCDNGEEIVSSYSLGNFEKRLDTKLFFKCHRSHIVKIDKVRHVENEGYLVMYNGDRIPVSKSGRKVFLDILKDHL